MSRLLGPAVYSSSMSIAPGVVLSLCTCWVLFTACAHTTHRIVLIFRGSKYSQIAVLKEFIENILQMHVAHVRGSTGAQKCG